MLVLQFQYAQNRWKMKPHTHPHPPLPPPPFRKIEEVIHWQCTSITVVPWPIRHFWKWCTITRIYMVMVAKAIGVKTISKPLVKSMAWSNHKTSKIIILWIKTWVKIIILIFTVQIIVEMLTFFFLSFISTISVDRKLPRKHAFNQFTNTELLA